MGFEPLFPDQPAQHRAVAANRAGRLERLDVDVEGAGRPAAPPIVGVALVAAAAATVFTVRSHRRTPVNPPSVRSSVPTPDRPSAGQAQPTLRHPTTNASAAMMTTAATTSFSKFLRRSFLLSVQRPALTFITRANH